MRLNFRDILLFENEHYFIVNKPYGISTLDHRHQDKPSMLAFAREYHAEAQVCHRLDMETSGILVFAKHPEAYRHLAIQFEQRVVHKLYHAVTTGVHDFEELEVDLPINVLKNGNARIDRSEGKPAVTIFNTLQAYRHTSLIQCEPITGRLHQIRVHLAWLKAPLLADQRYGGPMLYLSQIKRKFKLAKDTEEKPLIGRVALHSCTIGFRNLHDLEQIQVGAPYPKDMHALIRQLDLHDK